MITLWDELNKGFSSYSSWDLYPEIRDTDDAIILTAEVPGVKKEGIDLQTNNGILSLVAETSNRRKSHSFRLPSYVDQAAITASLEDGVLTVRIPKSEAHKPRKILPS
jgi:HSP20 family protein